jgi:hypothetical protein
MRRNKDIEGRKEERKKLSEQAMKKESKIDR